MKKYFYLLQIFIFGLFWNTISAQVPPYCMPEYSTGCTWGDGLTNFQLGDINQVIPCSGTPIYYHDFTAESTGIEQGSTVTLTVISGYSKHYVDVWIDFNDDDVFDASETVVDNLICNSTGIPYTANINIPMDAPLGQHSMRYRTNWLSEITDPCASYSYGNSADFTVNIIALSSPATVTTQALTDITSTTATGNGNITALGSPNPTAYGVCWNTSGTPTTADDKTDEGAASTTAAFTSNITGLTANTTYYVRAYATNSVETAYGEEVSFTTLQALSFSTTPTTTAAVGTAYSYSAFASDGSDTIPTVTCPTKPDWLSFSPNGSTSSTQVGETITKPGGIACDASGNTYVVSRNTVDNGSYVYKIAPDGTVDNTWAQVDDGQVFAMYENEGYLYIAYHVNNAVGFSCIRKISLSNPGAGQTTVYTESAQFKIISIVFKDGYIYASLIYDAKIIKINPDTGTATDFVAVTNPYGLGFDVKGNLYIIRNYTGEIYKYDGTTLSTIISGLSSPTSVRIDPNGYLYVSMYSGGIRKYAPTDYNSYDEILAAGVTNRIYGMDLAPNGSLVFGLYSQNICARMGTGAFISGTPAVSDVGPHNVVLTATNASTSVNQEFVINVQGPPTLTNFPDLNGVIGANFDLTAPGSNSNGAFTYTSSDTTVASISGNTVSPLTIGTTTIKATQAADGNYLAGTITCTLTVSALPTVSTQAVTDITSSTATGNGTITDLGSPNPTAYGVCWNTSGTPTTADNKTDEGAASTTGAFTSAITSLSADSTYYVRAYATNSAGTVYGEEVSFTTLSSPYYMAKSAGDWSNTSIWYTNNTGGVDPSSYTTIATVAPTALNSRGIIIDNDIVVDASVNIDQTSVNSGKSLIVNSGVTLTVANGDGTDLLVNGTLTNSGTISVGTGTVDVNGTFDSQGLFEFTDGGNLLLSGTVSSFVNFTKSTSTVSYDGANQTIVALDYYNLALAGAGSTKTFADGITQVDQHISISESMIITGSSASAVTVKANGSSRVFFVNINNTTATISNLTITGGNVTDHGGGICFSTGWTEATLNVENCEISGNSANGSFKYGGGIYQLTGGTLNVNGCTISDNTAFMGGGIGLTGTLYLSNSTITGNTGTEFSGGIATNTSSIMYLVNSTISGNNGGIYGPGGFYNSKNTYMLNTIVINNTKGSGEAFDIWNGMGTTNAYYSWYSAIQGTILTNALAPSQTDAYIVGSMGPLQNNGGSTNTLALFGTPAYQNGGFVYYNETDGYYLQGSDDQYYTLSSFTQITPSNPETDKITLDQRGVARHDPPCEGAYDENYTPTIQATDVAFTSTLDTQQDISWTRGNGEACIVFMSEETSGLAKPVIGIQYTPNSVFGSGDQIGTTGWYCVYKGADTVQTVTGLTPATVYRVHVCEYNYSSIYRVDEAANNPNNLIICTNPTSGGTIAENQISCISFDPDEITSSELPTGHTGTLEYKWQQSSTSSTEGFTDIASSNSPSFNPSTISLTTWYKRLARVECESDWTGAVESNVVEIKIYPTFTVGSISADQTICYNTAPAEFIGVAPTGGNTPYTYQWQSSTDGTTFNDIIGATNLNYQAGALSETMYYKLIQNSASECGSLATNIIIITNDTIKPVITSTHTDKEVDADANCEAILADYTLDVTATDNCDSDYSGSGFKGEPIQELTVTQIPAAGTTIFGELNTVKLTVSDKAGNFAEVSFNVKVVDNTKPTITSTHSDKEVDADANCEAVLADYTLDVTATDNCDSDYSGSGFKLEPVQELTVTQIPAAGTTIFGELNTVKLTVSDKAGNFSEVSFNVKVVDNTKPTITSTHADKEVDADANCEAVLEDYTLDVTATDNCDSDLTVTQLPVSGTTISGTANMVTLTVTDDAGNFSEVSFNVEVVDNTHPTITSTHTDVEVDADANCEAVLADYTLDVTATDNCDNDLTITQIPVSGTTISGTTNLVTLTVTDNAGNFSEVSFNVEVVDNTNPSITSTHTDVEVDADANCEAVLADYTLDVIATDNCDNKLITTQLPISGTTISGTTNLVTLTVTDNVGNFSEVSFNVKVVDNTNPTITSTHADKEVDANANCEAVLADYTLGVSATDNCDNSLAINQLPAAGSIISGTTNLVTLRVTDDAGNFAEVSFNVEVVDNTNPTITSTHADIEVEANVNCEAVLSDYTSGVSATDNCDNSLSITQLPAAGTLISGVTNQVTLTATDEAGNFSAVSFNVKVVDNINPLITSTHPDKIINVNENGVVILPDYTGTMVATDNCAGLNYSQSPLAGTALTGPSNTIILTVTDASGNKSSVSFNLKANTLPAVNNEIFNVIQSSGDNVLINIGDEQFGEDGRGSIRIVTPPSFGSAVIIGGALKNNGDYQIIYTPNVGFVGTDRFVYEICDLDGDCKEILITIEIEVDELNISRGFSPNGDGINDEFIIGDLHIYPNNSLIIINRWGNKVFEAKPYNNDWKGTNHFGAVIGEEDLPEGTYFYIFDPGNNTGIRKGHFYLKRK